MAKFKVGDVVTPSSTSEGDVHTWLIKGAFYKVVRVGTGAWDHLIGVEGEFQEDYQACDWGEDWFELAESKTTAESLRNSILNIRSKREALQKEILQLDKQEKEAVEKLKEQGFVLYEDNVSEEVVATENKIVLYAEDIEEDMTDYWNWRVGDLVQCVSISNMADMTEGENYEIKGIDGEYISLIDDVGDEASRESDARFKFHSRPVK